MGLKIPVLFMVGDYDMDAKLVGIPIKGQGTFSANASKFLFIDQNCYVYLELFNCSII